MKFVKNNQTTLSDILTAIGDDKKTKFADFVIGQIKKASFDTVNFTHLSESKSTIEIDVLIEKLMEISKEN